MTQCSSCGGLAGNGHECPRVEPKKKWKRIAHAIEISKRDGRDLLQDKEGPMIYTSKLKARDGMRAARAQGRFNDHGKAELVRVKLTIEKIE